MNRTIGCFLAVFIFLSPMVAFGEHFKSAGTTDVYFSPNGGATEAIVQELKAAKHEILVQAYSFTSVPIANALTAAKKRGIRIEVILDRSNRRDKYTAADFVAHAGIPVFIDSQHSISHNNRKPRNSVT